MPVKNAYTITLKVEKYLKDNPEHGMQSLLNILGMKDQRRVLQLINDQSWEKKHVEKLKKGQIVRIALGKLKRKNIERAEEISRQVKEFIDELGNVNKLAKLLGWESRITYFNRLEHHNWTLQEKALLINKRILDDTF